MKKSLVKSVLMTAGIVGMLGGVFLAANGTGSGEIDITAPYGKLTLLEATNIDGTNYTSSSEITVQIYAKDDTCTDEEIDMYISTSPIDKTTRIEDGDWENYTPGATKKFPVNTNGVTTIYAVFRDPSGNTSAIYSGGNTEYTINYYNNDNSTIFLSKKAYFGMAATITNQHPEKANCFFKGWSTTAGSSTVDYEPEDLMSAANFKGNSTTISLYPVWTAAEEYPLLSSVVKVGDYVNYPVYYDNVTPYGGYTSTYEGWRVIGVEDDGTVNLVSAGVPLSYDHAGNTSLSVANLTTNFFSTPFSVSDSWTYRKSGFTPYTSLKEAFTNNYTEMKADGVTPNVRAMMKEDVTAITGEENFFQGTYLTAPAYGDMFRVGAYYWLASASDSNGLWGVDTNGLVLDCYAVYEFGVRPVVSLKSEIKTTGTNTSGVWELVEE